MKKIIVLVLFIFSSNIFGYDLKIDNKTTSRINVEIEYAGSGFCKADSVSLPAYSSKTLKTGLCCAERFSVLGKSGPLKGVNKSIYTDLCRHIFTITESNIRGRGKEFQIDDKKW